VAKDLQFGLAVGFHAFEPVGWLLVPGVLGRHGGEAGHVAGEAVGLGAVAGQAGQQVLLAGAGAPGWPQQAAGDLADLRCWRGAGRWAGAGVLWLEAAADGAQAGAVAPSCDLGV
jgi:hypothetical protein